MNKNIIFYLEIYIFYEIFQLADVLLNILVQNLIDIYITVCCLKNKLKYYGLSESLVKWFQDYISNRKQIVFINNSESRIGLLKAGVPQGSVLDPLLFLIYPEEHQL
jgi:hypothetical protein